MPRKSGGRIHPSERAFDDTTPIIGGNIEISATHHLELAETKQNETCLKTKREHRNREGHFMEFLRVNYPDYYVLGTREITEKEHRDPKYFYHKNKRTLIYSGFNTELFLAFLVSRKYKNPPTNTILFGHSHHRKYVDSILYGARASDEMLPSQFYMKIDNYLSAIKKEIARAKKDGNVVERDSDPIPIGLYKKICEWAIEDGNVFLWAWTVLQWNLMARPISVEPLNLHNFTVGQDNFKVKFNCSKVDQEAIDLCSIIYLRTHIILLCTPFWP